MMRTFITSLFITACTLTLSAQKKLMWFDAGVKVQAGASGLYNSAIADIEGLNYELALTNAVGFGGRIGINKNYSGLSLEAMYTRAGQTYEFIEGGNAINRESEWRSLDVYALFRNAKNLGYFEIGPKVSFLSEFTDTNGADASANFASTNIGAVVGFGAYVIGSDGAFSGTLGLRFEYGITDYVGTDAPDGFNGTGNTYTDASGAGVEGSEHPFFAGVVFEINWGIGYFGVAQCGARSKFIMF